MAAKPDDIFDRDAEWTDLDAHVRKSASRLGIVTGRRRVGKTYLLRRLAERHRGLLVSALSEERTPALAHFAEALGRFHGTDLGPPRDWRQAIDLATRGPLAVPLLVIDELPYLTEHSPELESVLQHAVDASRDDRRGTRILLAGSALSVMAGLTDGGRPLRGRAGVNMLLTPFDYRTARSFWSIDNPAVAFRVHAVLGGSPGYRALVRDTPKSVRSFDRWITDTMFNPASALHREDAYLLAEDRRVGEAAVYGSVLRAIASGEQRPSRIAGRLGRPQTNLSHALGVLSEAGFIRNEAGMLTGRDPKYRIVDPVVRFLRSCVEPWRGLVGDGRLDEAWESARPSWSAGVLGPHLEELARQWASRFADRSAFGGPAGVVGRAEIADPAVRKSREIDLVVLRPGERPGPGAGVQAIGEVKLTADVDAVNHLDRCAELLQARGHGRPERLVVVAERATKELRALAAARRDLRLAGLDELYG